MTELPQLDARTADGRVRDGAILVDVREDDEWAAGHAPAARHIPLSHLPAHLPRLRAGDEHIVVCRSGSRSARAQAALAQAGMTVHNLDGGMRAWHDAGLPVVRDDGSPGAVI
ncbi:MAG: rhodanese-like domain-containing protein [Candidatus Dormibacteria bacterium]